MSFLFKPSSGGGGGGIAGTAVDPLGPSGVLIDPLTELTQPAGPLPADRAILTDGLGGYVFGTVARESTFSIQFTHDAAVPVAGTRYLRYGQGVISSTTGFRMGAAARLRGISIRVDAVSANTYTVEVLKDPAGRLGVPVVLASLVLPAASLGAAVRTLSVAVAAADELGARIVRTAGAGASTFAQIAVMTEWAIP